MTWLFFVPSSTGQIDDAVSPKSSNNAKPKNPKVGRRADVNTYSPSSRAESVNGRGRAEVVKGWQYDMIGHVKNCAEHFCKILGVGSDILRHVHPRHR